MNSQEKTAQQEILWVRSAENSADHYEATGLHITLEEVKKWANILKIDRLTTIPECHT